MTPIALFHLLGHIGLILFGIASILIGIWAALVFDYVHVRKPFRRPLRESLRSNRAELVVPTLIGVFLIVSGVKLPPDSANGTAFYSPFLIVGFVAVVVFMFSELRLALRIRRQRGSEQAASTDNSDSNWTEH
jgi:hypothetical protein